MKVFFITSPRAKKTRNENIEKIYKLFEKLGCKHTCEFIMRVDVDRFYSGDQKYVSDCYKDMVDGVKQAEFAIFEASADSLAVGYLVNLALSQGKPVIVLHLGDYSPYLFENIQDEKLVVMQYEIHSLERTLKQAIDIAREQVDVRFNFFISPSIGTYLDWVSKNKKIPRAVYLRKLIEEDMKKSDYIPKKETSKSPLVVNKKS